MTSLTKEKTHSVVFLSNLQWQNLVRDSNILLGIKPWKISHSRNPETEIEVQKFCSVLSGMVISAHSVLPFQKYVSHQWKKECGGWEGWFDQGWRGFFWIFFLYISTWKKIEKEGRSSAHSWCYTQIRSHFCKKFVHLLKTTSEVDTVCGVTTQCFTNGNCET